MPALRKIIVAPDSFKETLSASVVATEIAAALRAQLPHCEVVELPVADGGEGTLDALLAATQGQRRIARVHDPLGRPINAEWGLLGDGDTAIIEMASASGLALLAPHERNPLITSSAGTGELIRAALDAGARRFMLAIGGSASNDGGSGMLSALGLRFLDQADQVLPPGGAALARLARIDLAGLDTRLAECSFAVACDVDNPLTGSQGASAVFGPQKGATPAMVIALDAALAHYARIIHATRGLDVAQHPGAGAAGGVGAAALAFLDGSLQPGIELVLDAIGFAEQLAGADLLITGEGRLDGQTLHGKAPIGVARRAHAAGLPVIAIAGSLGEGAERLRECGFRAVFACVPRPMTAAEALRDARERLRHTAEQVAALLALTDRD
ncbi:glycerate kinase [Chitinilyticum litopenaei]|uniref:glycerate kinase n=1 Tax=Chitinilyticum litopenaei TaxID=1121276 RepID=UPI000424FD3A|nr:glycerate kinase [Chitinilyticum litopenaei]